MIHCLFREGREVLVRNGGGETYFLAIQWTVKDTIILSHLGGVKPQFVFIYTARETVQNSMVDPLCGQVEQITWDREKGLV